MYVEELVEVAIGLVLAWLVLSVATTHIQEVIVGWLGLRADGLEDILESMLTGERKRMGPVSRFWEQIIRRERFSKLATLVPKATNAVASWINAHSPSWVPAVKDDIRTDMWQRSVLLNKFYEHPIIGGLSLGENSKPSYISADDFTTTLFQVITTAGTDESVIKKTMASLEENKDELLDTVAADLMVDAGSELARLFTLYREADSKRKGAAEQEARALEQQANDLVEQLTEANALLARLPQMLQETGVIEQMVDLADDDETAGMYVQMCREAVGRLLDEEQQAVLNSETAAQMRRKMNEMYGKYQELQPYMDALLQTNDDSALTVEQLQKNVARMALGHPVVSRSMNTMLRQAQAATADAEAQLAAARKEIENWFNNSMDRASGWYKRNRQWGAFSIAFFLAAIINVDTVHLGQRLWYEPALRQAIVAQATDYDYEDDAGEQTDGNEELSSLSEVQQDIQGFSNELLSLGFPIGWRLGLAEEVCSLEPDPDIKTEVGGIQLGGSCLAAVGWTHSYTKIFGWILTGLAAMQGAPFWFDILQKLAGVRGSGKTPDSREEEEKPDRTAAMSVTVQNTGGQNPAN